MKAEAVKKLADDIDKLQSCHHSKVIENDPNGEVKTVVLSCSVKLDVKARDAEKIQHEFDKYMTTLIKPLIDNKIKELQAEVQK